MKRSLFLVPALGLALLTPHAFSQESASGKETFAQKETETAANPAEGPLAVWRWANFLLLAGGLGYLVGKYAGPFFASRSRSIRQDMIDAEEARKAADQRAAAVEVRLAGLETEIARLRAESQREAASEQERIRQQTAADMAKIRTQAAQEIEAAGKTARLELKRYSAELAIELAEEKLRTRVTSETQEALVRGFVSDLEASAQAQAT